MSSIERGQMTISPDQVKKDVSEEVAYRNLLLGLFRKSFPHPNPNGDVHHSPRFRNFERDWEFTFHAFTWIIARVNIDADEIKEMWQHVGDLYRNGFTEWMDEYVHHGWVPTAMAERYAELTA